jgi:hypothetical protein
VSRGNNLHISGKIEHEPAPRCRDLGRFPLPRGGKQNCELTNKSKTFSADGASAEKTTKVLIIREDDGTLLVGDVIQYGERFWLVPAWIPGPTLGIERPARIICVDDMKTTKPPPQYKVDLALRDPLSQALLEGRETKQGVSVIEQPDIFRRVDTDYGR